jgi:hypothetical protein
MLAPGDRAAILLGNRVETVESCLAIAHGSGSLAELTSTATRMDRRISQQGGVLAVSHGCATRGE